MKKVTMIFNIMGDPVAKARPRFTGRGGSSRAYTPKKTTDYENRVENAFALKQVEWELLNGIKWPLDWTYKLTILASFRIPESYPKWRKDLIKEGRIKMTTKPDWDNIGKIVSDALNGVAYLDDGQVAGASVQKQYVASDDEEPSVYVMIEGYCDKDDRWTEDYKAIHSMKQAQKARKKT